MRHPASPSIIEHQALKHQPLNKRKQGTVAASYNAVGGLNHFVGRRSSKINLLAAFNSSGVFKKELRTLFPARRGPLPLGFRVLHSERECFNQKCHTRGTSGKAEDPL
jgi:hypothetical protein